MFVIEDRHVRFDINRRAASNASLSLSARLLERGTIHPIALGETQA
jgi:hypothetical protein